MYKKHLSDCRSLILFILIHFVIACDSPAKQLLLEIYTPQVPVLIGEEVNPVQRIMILNPDSSAFDISQVIVTLKGTTDLSEITSVCLYKSKQKDRTNFSSDSLVAFVKNPIKEKIVFDFHCPVLSDTAYFWIGLTLDKKANLSNKVAINTEKVNTSAGYISSSAVSLLQPALRPGIAVRKHWQDSVHTSRIPGLATSKAGTLLAVFDARYESSRDLQGHMDIGLHRSVDGGQTWQPMQIVLDQKQWGGLPERFNGVSDACVLVDDNTGTIYIAGLWMHGILDGKTGKWVEGLNDSSKLWIHQWHNKGSQPGLSVKQTSQFLITRSEDDGVTWSEPLNITAQAKREEWWLFAPAPGHGVTLVDGTLVFPTQGRDKNGLPFSNITYSKDGGETWITSEPAAENTTECMVAQLPDGGLMLNMRDNRNSSEKGEKNGRNIAVTYDLGKTWIVHPTSHNALIEPTCMASLHKHDYVKNGESESLLLFSNPDSKYHRNHMTLKVSSDAGQTWKTSSSLLLDEWGSFGYSCITSVNDSVVGILYEGSKAQMIFQQVSLSELEL